jgi:hypothetical protein
MIIACRPIRYGTARRGRAEMVEPCHHEHDRQALRERVRALLDGHDFTGDPLHLPGFRAVEALKKERNPMTTTSHTEMRNDFHTQRRATG